MQTNPDYLAMSDEDVSKLTTPDPVVAVPAEQLATEVVEEPAKTEKVEEVVEDPAAVAKAAADQKALDDAAAAEAAQVAADAEKAAKETTEKALGAPDDKLEPIPEKKPKVEETKAPKTEVAKTDEEKAAGAAAATKLAEEEAAKKAAEKVTPAPMTVDEKAAALDSLMSFKANGKEINLRSPAELLQLAQMGANYTKKMQKLQPAMRLIKMLDNNKLMDPDQLSFLIDLHQKKPEAIQKLLVDSGFDPNGVDTEQAAKYKPSAHQVSDVEIEFQTVLEEVEASAPGQELLIEITQQWDEGSRRALFQQPRLLAELNVQKSLGLYGQITKEMEHRKTLGNLQNVPFLVAYEAIGKELHTSGALKFPVEVAKPAPKTTEPVKPVVAATRTVVPPSKVANNEKAAAASAPKTNASSVKTEPDYLNMPDSEFLQQMQGRL